MAKRLPKGIWTDKKRGYRGRVRYYDSRSKMYRVYFLGIGDFWETVERFEKEWSPPTLWERLNA